MGRSVSTHRHAVATVFLHLEFEDQDDAQYEFESFLEDLQDNVLTPRYPSMTKCDRWQDREDHVIMENSQVEVSVSEYCGCVAICLAPKFGTYDDDAWNEAQAHRMANNFQKHIQKMFKSCAMVPVATASNGETFFRKI